MIIGLSINSYFNHVSNIYSELVDTRQNIWSWTWSSSNFHEKEACRMRSVEKETFMMSLGHGSLISQNLQDGQINTSNIQLSDANIVQLPTGYFGSLYWSSRVDFLVLLSMLAMTTDTTGLFNICPISLWFCFSLGTSERADYKPRSVTDDGRSDLWLSCT